MLPAVIDKLLNMGKHLDSSMLVGLKNCFNTKRQVSA